MATENSRDEINLVEDKEPLDLLEDKVSDHKVEETIIELRTKHPMAATILEKIHNMDSQRNYNGNVCH